MSMFMRMDARAAKSEITSASDRFRFFLWEGMDRLTRKEMMPESRKRVPVDTGELRDSDYVEDPQWKGNHLQQRMGYTADHALVVHEDPDAFHRVGEWKYLESVLNEYRPHVLPRVVSYATQRAGL